MHLISIASLVLCLIRNVILPVSRDNQVVPMDELCALSFVSLHRVLLVLNVLHLTFTQVSVRPDFSITSVVETSTKSTIRIPLQIVSNPLNPTSFITDFTSPCVPLSLAGTFPRSSCSRYAVAQHNFRTHLALPPRPPSSLPTYATFFVILHDPLSRMARRIRINAPCRLGVRRTNARPACVRRL